MASVVIDSGSCWTKFGLSNKTDFVKLLKTKEGLISNGVIEDWDEIEKAWQYIFDELQVRASEKAVFLTQPSSNPKANRARTIEVMLEKFGAPSVYLSEQSALPLYAYGLTSGVVLESGDSLTEVVPIFDGFLVPKAKQSYEVSGKELTKYLDKLLKEDKTDLPLETVRKIKEECCYLAENIEEIEDCTYTLPDGSQVRLGKERLGCPEALFHPALINSPSLGIQDIVLKAVRSCEIDIRKTLFSNIVLSGGNTCFIGFEDRLAQEVRKKANVKVKVDGLAERQYGVWIGGAIVSSLSSFEDLWITKSKYQELGIQKLV